MFPLVSAYKIEVVGSRRVSPYGVSSLLDAAARLVSTNSSIPAWRLAVERDFPCGVSRKADEAVRLAVDDASASFVTVTWGNNRVRDVNAHYAELEESMFPGASDGSFLDRVHMYHGKPGEMGM